MRLINATNPTAVGPRRTPGMSQIVGGRNLHPYQEPPALGPAFLPAVNVMGQVTLAPQIEIADAEVGSHNDAEGFLKCWGE